MNMVKNNKSDSLHSPTIIVHQVNLTFDMRIINIGVNREIIDNAAECTSKTRRDPRELREDGNGKSQDNSHEQNYKDRICYVSNDDPLHGKYNGNSRGVINVVSVHHMISSDDFVGNESEGDDLKEYGKYCGNRNTTGTPTVEATLVSTRENRH